MAEAFAWPSIAGARGVRYRTWSPILRSRDDVDTKRMGLWGGSYGGYLTALGLARNSDIFCRSRFSRCMIGVSESAACRYVQ
jgi:hypothetical protein